MGFDLLAGRVHVFRESGDFENRFLVPGRRHDVGVGLLLDPLDGGALGTDDQSDDPVGDPDLNCGLPGGVGHQLTQGQGGVDVVFARGSNLGKVIGRRKDFAFGGADVLLAAGDHEDRFLPAHGGLDVSVGLGSQGFDFAA